MRFRDQVAIVTAAANGIGRATAEIIAREGGVVVCVDRDGERLAQAIDALRAAGGRAEARRADVLEAAEVAKVIEGTVAMHGRIDILVNAVGGSTIIEHAGSPVDALTFDEWRKLIAFNLDGMFLFSSAAAAIMKRQGSGKIVNVSSIAARGLAAAASCAYAAAKGGVNSFTKKLSYELGPFGITVNGVAPGRTLTERMRPIWEGKGAEEQAAEIARTPLRRIAEASDPAKVICFLASKDADFVTGVTIDVTGGL